MDTLLPPDELRAADRIVAERERRLHLAGRAALRLLLGARLGREPSGLRFAVGRWGRPGLADTAAGVSFNIAHSGDVVLVALGPRAVGVDVERTRPRTDHLGIATRFYAESEVRWLAAIDPERRGEGFLRLWTRKEAVVKAVGLALPLYSAEALVLGDEGRGQVALDDGATRHLVHWLDLEPCAGYTAAVAVVGEPPSPTLRELILA